MIPVVAVGVSGGRDRDRDRRRRWFQQRQRPLSLSRLRRLIRSCLVSLFILVAILHVGYDLYLMRSLHNHRYDSLLLGITGEFSTGRRMMMLSSSSSSSSSSSYGDNHGQNGYSQQYDHHRHDRSSTTETDTDTATDTTNYLTCEDIVAGNHSSLVTISKIGEGKKKSVRIVSLMSAESSDKDQDSNAELVESNNTPDQNTSTSMMMMMMMIAKRSRSFHGRRVSQRLLDSFVEIEKESRILKGLYEKYGPSRTIKYYGDCFDYRHHYTNTAEEEEEGEGENDEDDNGEENDEDDNTDTVEDSDEADDEADDADHIGKNEADEQSSTSTSTTTSTTDKNNINHILLSHEGKKYCKRDPQKMEKMAKRRLRKTKKDERKKKKQEKNDQDNEQNIDHDDVTEEQQNDHNDESTTTNTTSNTTDNEYDKEMNCTFYQSGDFESGGATLLIEVGTPLKTGWDTINVTEWWGEQYANETTTKTMKKKKKRKGQKYRPSGGIEDVPLWTLNGLNISQSTIEDMDFIAQQYTYHPDGPHLMGMLKQRRGGRRRKNKKEQNQQQDDNTLDTKNVSNETSTAITLPLATPTPTSTTTPSFASPTEMIQGWRLISDNMYPQQYVYVQAGLRHADVGMVFPINDFVPLPAVDDGDDSSLSLSLSATEQLVLDINRCIALYTALGVKYWLEPNKYRGGRPNKEYHTNDYNCQEEFRLQRTWLL